MRSASFVVFCLWATSVSAAPEIIAGDLDRLARYDEAAGRAILDALARGDAEDVDALSAALADRPLAPEPAGDWRCRTIKAGGRTGLAVFAQFDCRITLIGPTEWRFEKLTGSERSLGTIAFHEGQAIYRGVGFSGDAPALPYEAFDTDPNLTSDTIPQIAVFEQTGPDEARLTFPYPNGDSAFDVLHLTR
ncbi:DUF4893 domain-containing protein [Palleronia sp. LCG004]|uniref:DUF4893 domain-containing protein n=1 Tax=Palleronia sp. LCG004 TaxID=3079304 RepID=UPI002941F6D3|nr:DUF4893 domain-containing protein [Palleronia sp. LCG004]WOI57386.1 DUF4893 domain-containing protein [Palleronia sp. LCG004]